MNDELKAIEEAAKASHKALDVSEKLGRFLNRIIGGAADEFGNILEDWAAFIRFKNLVKIQDKVEAIHSKRKLKGKIKPISPRLAIPLIEGASVEDNEDLQEIWARLIANSTDPNWSGDIHPSFITVIKQLTPDEAVILTTLYKKANSYPVVLSDLVYLNEDTFHIYPEPMIFENILKQFENICSEIELNNNNNILAYLDNLKRLGLVQLTYSEQQALSSNNEPFSTSTPHEKLSLQRTRHETLELTAFCDQFIKACIEDL